MKLQKKHIIGIAIAVGILILGLVIWLVPKSSEEGSHEDYYEGETVPIETAQDIFDEEQENSTSENSDGKANVDASGNDEKVNVNTSNDDEKANADVSGNDQKNTNKDNSAENDVKEDGADKDDTNKSDNGTKEEDVETDIDEGWAPFY